MGQIKRSQTLIKASEKNRNLAAGRKVSERRKQKQGKREKCAGGGARRGMGRGCCGKVTGACARASWRPPSQEAEVTGHGRARPARQRLVTGSISLRGSSPLGRLREVRWRDQDGLGAGDGGSTAVEGPGE